MNYFCVSPPLPVRYYARIMYRTTFRFLIATLIAALVFAAVPRAAAQTEPSPTRRAQPPLSLRLYVFDCGTIHPTDLARFSLKPDEVPSPHLSTPAVPPHH